MSQVEDFNLYFILSSENSSSNASSTDMKAAYDSVLKYGAVAEWVKPSFCLQHSAKLNDVFVFEKFEGPAFEELKKHRSKYVILGARCLLTCLADGRSIPAGTAPVLTEGMRDLVISCSGFDNNTKKIIREKVEYMGGVFDKALRNATTHIIVHNTLSQKAFTAAGMKIPIMKKDWVDEVWKQSLFSNVNGKDECFRHLRAPSLHNLIITTSGIVKGEKERIKSLIKKNGGTFTGEMEENKTSIVIISKADGEKYKFATQWNIPCVTPQWLYNCESCGHILDIKDYRLLNKPKSSTPNKDVSSITANFSMISRIEEPDHCLMKHIDETTSSVSVREFQTPRTKQKDNTTSRDVLMSLQLEDVKRAGKFLDGFNIFLYGFNPKQLDKLKKILNLGGATRFDEFSASVTHILVNVVNNDLQMYKKNGVVILLLEWLLKSIELGKPAPEEQYLCFEPVLESNEPPSPLTKHGARLLSQNKHTVSKLSFNDDLPAPQPPIITHDLPEEDLIKKYNFESAEEAFKELDNLSNKSDRMMTPKPDKSQKSAEEISHESRNTSASDIAEAIFNGLRFYVANELEEDQKKFVCELITERGGQLVTKRFPGVPDYAVVPVEGAILNDITTKEVVNVFFIVECCRKKCITNFSYYHQPVAMVKGTAPLHGCVITVSSYVETEREFVEQLIMTLGAVCQSSLARKDKDGVLKSTHLVCLEPTGPKYNGALRWGLPIVHHDWLFKCASVGHRVSEEPYLVGDSKLPSLSKLDSVVAKPSTPQTAKNAGLENRSVISSNVKRPVATAAKIVESTNLNSFSDFTSQAAVKTTSKENHPLVSNRVVKLRQESTPSNIPEANRTLTPTSPYGAFCGNDNPSPGTRKRLLRWMHQGADFPQDPPMKLDTPDKSTPISKVLSRYLESMKRAPEDQPPDDSPVARKKPNLDLSVTSSNDDTIAAALKRMKEIENNYVQIPKEQTPVSKSKDSSVSYPMVVIQESQPHTEVGWEDPREKEMALDKLEKSVENEIQIKVYMLSGFSEIDDVRTLIEESGGRLSTANGFDTKATHLIATNLTRAEKVMCSICAGLWVLHPSYLDELKQVKSVYAVSEDDYEWGNPNKTTRLESLPSNAKECAQSAYYWRDQRKRKEPPPFQQLSILLHVPASRYEAFRKMIVAGGGSVVQAKPPYDERIHANLCVCDVTHQEKINMDSLSKQGTVCVAHTYISDKIFKKLNNIEHYFVPGFKKT